MRGDKWGRRPLSVWYFNACLSVSVLSSFVACTYVGNSNKSRPKIIPISVSRIEQDNAWCHIYLHKLTYCRPCVIWYCSIIVCRSTRVSHISPMLLNWEEICGIVVLPLLFYSVLELQWLTQVSPTRLIPPPPPSSPKFEAFPFRFRRRFFTGKKLRRRRFSGINRDRVV